jgi:8-oxo-dGTP pyrophosphatase MutT (NUDIX family)
MTSTEVVERRGARVLLIDDLGRVLLFRGHDPADPAGPAYWFTVGGGVDAGESDLDAAARETFEETGLSLQPDDFSGPVWHEVAEFPFDGRQYRQSQDFFVARTAQWAVDTRGFVDTEVRSVVEHRWWAVDELRDTSETVYPDCLADLLAGVLVGGGRDGSP